MLAETSGLGSCISVHTVFGGYSGNGDACIQDQEVIVPWPVKQVR
jgi:hypothetical protein